MAKAKYTDPAHVKDAARHRLSYWAKKNNELYQGIKPFGWSVAGKSADFIDKQAKAYQRNVRGRNIVQTSTGRIYKRSLERQYRGYLQDVMRQAGIYYDKNNALYGAVNRVLGGMPISRFADFHDWMSSRGMEQLLEPSTYGYWDPETGEFIPNDPEQTAHMINNLYLALRQYMIETGYGKSLLRDYDRATKAELYNYGQFSGTKII